MKSALPPIYYLDHKTGLQKLNHLQFVLFHKVGATVEKCGDVVIYAHKKLKNYSLLSWYTMLTKMWRCCYAHKKLKNYFLLSRYTMLTSMQLQTPQDFSNVSSFNSKWCFLDME